MNKAILSAFAASFLTISSPVFAASPLDEYRLQAKQENPDFTVFSVERGKTLFVTRYASGKPETPACTSCHTQDPTQSGQTRAGKQIDPLAISRTPDRYSNKRKVEKWFRRNCNSVLGRACSPVEKGDFITFMQSQ